MSGKLMPIGPFIGGLNTSSGSGEAQDDEVTKLVNFEVAVDTSLTSRPPFKLRQETIVTGVSNNWRILCIYRVSRSEWHLITSRPTADGFVVEGYTNGDTSKAPSYTIKTLTGSANEVMAATQFAEYVFFTTGVEAAQSSFRWRPLDGASDITTMPKGTSIIAWKERLWIAGTGRASDGNRVKFSKIDATGSHPETWDTSDYFDVAVGEGGFITSIHSLMNNLVVFKNDGTWSFSYPSSVKNGTVDKISSNIGAAGPNCVVEFENLLYVYDQGKVYELINRNYNQLNRNVKFERDTESVDELAPDVDMSILNRRIVLRYQNSLYVFTVDTKTWSQWRSVNGTPGKFYELPGDSLSAESSTYLAATAGTLQSNSTNFINENFNVSYLQSSSPFEVKVPVKGTFTIDITTTGSAVKIHLNNQLGISDDSGTFNVPVSSGQTFTVGGSQTGTASATLNVMYYLSDGSTSTVSTSYTNGTASADLVVPNGAILAKVFVEITPAVGLNTFKEAVFKRTSTSSPRALIEVKDIYLDTSIIQELIYCELITKSYDYKQPGLFKRLFWWGIDIKTDREVETVLKPVGKQTRTTWGKLTEYTNSQLSYGTWGNPLSWLGITRDVMDISQAPVEVSENGRYFVKLLKAIRFRQIVYSVKTSTLGNKATGPAKVFTLTTVVDPKATVVEKTT